MRLRLFLSAGALALAACALFPDFGSLQGEDGSDASIPNDVGDASVGADAASEASATTDGGDAGADSGERAQDNTTIFCGPAMECSHADPNNGCCVSIGDAGSPPSSYVFLCEDSSQCKTDSGSQPFIACDQGSDCPGANEVCCWPNAPYPLRIEDATRTLAQRSTSQIPIASSSEISACDASESAS